MTSKDWLVLTVRVAAPEAQGEVAEELLALGGTAVAQEGDRLTTYLAAPADLDTFQRMATERLGAFLSEPALAVEWRWQEDEDWAQSWRWGLQPRRAGEHLVVTPSWVEPDLLPDDIVIVIDPEMAFGTGEHATTRGALRAVETVIRPGDRVLDVGTGSAILAIAAARLGASEVLAVESDPDALENARDNLRRNGVAGQVELLHGLVDDQFLSLLGPGRFNLIVANVLSGVLVPLLPAFHTALAPVGAGPGGASAGHLILGGILEDEAEDVIVAARHAGFSLVIEDFEEEWWGGLFRVSRPGV